MSLKYFAGALLSIPLLPMMYFQGKQIRSKVPQLPEAKGNQGSVSIDDTKSPTLKLITLGESTIAGVGVTTHEVGFSGTLAKELAKELKRSIHWKVYAKSGFTAKKVTTDLIPQISEKEIDLIVVGLGGNDAFTLNTPWRWKSDMRKLIRTLQRKFPDTSIVFCNMPPIKEFPAFTKLIKFTLGNLVEILGDSLNQVVSEFDQVYYFGETITLKGWINKFDLKEQPQAFFSDGVHPSALTYQTWAKDIARKINANKELCTSLLKPIA
ncbi:MAG: GDSL family lipase [Flavobacteriaceae bacterium]|nr:GDSL family lipase [Flavobacteriaceae bacterium]|tara:strand:+ start:152526 stop:153326 length:801 start_codon:yes stop_codon:yes gene_type:complete